MRLKISVRPAGVRKVLAAGVAIAATAAAVPPAAAATISGNFTSSVPSQVNLTTAGPVDWAVWSRVSADTAYGATAAPDNRKAGTTALISSMTPFGNTSSLRGVGGDTVSFTYADGTSPTAFGPNTIGGVANSSLDSNGAGLQFTVAGDPARTLFVNVYVSGFNNLPTSTLTASLAGTSGYSGTSVNFGNGAKNPGLYTIAFRPDAATDLLTVRYALAEDTTGGNSHVLIDAVAVSTVPEPAAGLAAAAVVGLLLRRRRHTGR